MAFTSFYARSTVQSPIQHPGAGDIDVDVDVDVDIDIDIDVDIDG